MKIINKEVYYSSFGKIGRSKDILLMYDNKNDLYYFKKGGVLSDVIVTEIKEVTE